MADWLAGLPRSASPTRSTPSLLMIPNHLLLTLLDRQTGYTG
jgi:hypothetical protein